MPLPNHKPNDNIPCMKIQIQGQIRTTMLYRLNPQFPCKIGSHTRVNFKFKAKLYTKVKHCPSQKKSHTSPKYNYRVNLHSRHERIKQTGLTDSLHKRVTMKARKEVQVQLINTWPNKSTRPSKISHTKPNYKTKYSTPYLQAQAEHSFI